MSNKLNTRIKLKTDTSLNWRQKSSFVPMLGEVIIYKDEGAVPRIKIGDGIHSVSQLEFLGMNEVLVRKTEDDVDIDSIPDSVNILITLNGTPTYEEAGAY